MAWVSAGVGEFCVLISPCKRIDGSKKKKFTIFNKQNHDPESSLPSLIVLKYFSLDAVDIVCSGGPDNVEELFGGSSLLCITSPSKINEGESKDQKRAVSQIEAEAFSSQQGGDDKASVGADIPLHVRYISQFYYIRAIGTTPESVNSVKSFSNATLEPIGPVMSKVDDVAWGILNTSTSSQSQSQSVAVLVRGKINILSWNRQYSSDKNEKVSGHLSHLTTVELPSNPLDTSINLRWMSEVLFACSGHAVYAYTIDSNPGDIL